MRILLAVLLYVTLPVLAVAQESTSVEVDEAARIRAKAILALERAQAAQKAGDVATARSEVGLVVESLAPLPLGEGQDETAEILWSAGHAAHRAGSLALARESWSRVADHRERTLPADHPHLLRARLNLANTMYEMGDLAGARALYETVLAGFERTLPADHPDLLRARLNLANTMGAMGDLAGARALFEAVLAGYERTLPADHPDLLRARLNLAVTMQQMGDLAGARALFEAVLAARERTLPADHPGLLLARLNLAGTMYSMDDLAGARALYEAVLAGYERTLPADHPDLLRARGNLAGTMARMGDLAGARALEEAVLAGYERTLPPDHPDLLAARGNLAVTMRQMGDLVGARALQEAVLAGYERTLPADHPDLLTARLSIASTMRQMGDLAGARALQEAVLVARERTLPADHPGLLSARLSLAVTMRRMGDLAGASALEKAVLVARERTLPADHPGLLHARLSLANTMRQMGDLAGARALQEAVLAAGERTLPADHPDLLRARGNLAVTMVRMGDLAGARALEEAVLAGYERTLPADHPDLLAARGNLALTMARMGDLAGAHALQEAVLAGYEGTLPADHPGLLGARLSLASTMYSMGDLSGARAFQEAVLAARERTLPADHPDLLRARSNLAFTMHAMGDLGGAWALGLDLARGMLRRLELASTFSLREVREVTGAEAHRHSAVRFLTDSDGVASEGTESIRFDLAETLRATSIVSGRATGEDHPRRRENSTLRTRLNDLVSGGPREGQTSEAFAAEVARLTFERDRLEREIRKELAARGIVTGAVRAEDVARALPEGAAAVGFLRHLKWVLDPQTSEIRWAGEVLAAHVLSPDGVLFEVELGAADELAELASAWRAALGKPIERGEALEEDQADGEVEAGDALRTRILDPILAALGEETTTLHVCLDDFLHLVPIGALPLGPEEDAPRVRDRFEIVNEVSFTRLLAEPRPLAGEPSLLAMGGVTFDAELEGGGSAAPVQASSEHGDRSPRPDTFAPLLQTRFEAESVRVLFEEQAGEEAEAVLLMKKQATKAAFHEHAPGKRYLHVATHGWFAPETIPSTLDAREGEDETLWSRLGAKETVTGLAPMTLCGLAFAGANRGRDSLGRVPGILTAEELAGMDLSACELAVLSACETNVGIRRAGQGVQSLQAALHAAGVRTAITSLWKVDDAMTRRLMELLYTYLWVEKLPKAAALWKAKCDLRREGAPLRDWAGWVLSGDPD